MSIFNWLSLAVVSDDRRLFSVCRFISLFMSSSNGFYIVNIRSMMIVSCLACKLNWCSASHVSSSLACMYMEPTQAAPCCFY